MSKQIADAIVDSLISTSEGNRDCNPANLVDALFFIGREIAALNKTIQKINKADTFPY
jgi:hypothetical protein